MAEDAAALKKIACDAIDNKAKELHEISQKLWENPELGLEEHKAHDLLTTFLEKEGFPVERRYILDTAFRATVGGNTSGPHVAVLCEYDALPEIGHACGHNLIAEAGIGAGLGIKAALDSVDGRLGQATVFGTPDEEACGGKLHMIEAHAFKNISAAIMVHPFPRNLPQPKKFALAEVKVTYRGRASHAAGFPWEGVNALDAAVIAYNNVSVLRQQMKPTWRVHGIFTNGGAKPNIIPEIAALEYYARAPRMVELNILKEKMVKCFEGAAAATGCQVEIKWDPNSYQNMITNKCLAQLYTKNAAELGVTIDEDEAKTSAPTGSTDMGNVSHVVPSIHPMFYIGTQAANHTRDFATATGDPKAQPYTIKQAKALAMTAIDVFCNPALIEKLKAEFQEDLKKDSEM